MLGKDPNFTRLNAGGLSASGRVTYWLGADQLRVVEVRDAHDRALRAPVFARAHPRADVERLTAAGRMQPAGLAHVAAAKADGQGAMALTDLANLFGAVTRLSEQKGLHLLPQVLDEGFPAPPMQGWLGGKLSSISTTT